MAEIWEKIKPNKLNHKPQGTCEENKEEKNKIRLKYFAVKGSTLETCKRTVTLPIEVILTTKILHSIKVIVLSNSVLYKASFGCSHGNGHLKSRTGWFLRTVR